MLVQNQHGLGGIIAPDLRQFRLVTQLWDQAAKRAQNPDDPIQKAHGHAAELRLLSQQTEQFLALLMRGNRRTGAADGQDTVAKRGIVQTFGEVTAKVAIADRLAGSQGSIAKDQEGFALPQPTDLPGQRLEVGR